MKNPSPDDQNMNDLDPGYSNPDEYTEDAEE